MLMIAAFYGSNATIRFLLENGANVNARSPDDDMTALHLAVARGSSNLPAISALMQHGADPSIPDMLGRTAQDLLDAANGLPASPAPMATAPSRALGHPGAMMPGGPGLMQAGFGAGMGGPLFGAAGGAGGGMLPGSMPVMPMPMGAAAGFGPLPGGLGGAAAAGLGLGGGMNMGLGGLGMMPGASASGMPLGFGMGAPTKVGASALRRETSASRSICRPCPPCSR